MNQVPVSTIEEKASESLARSRSRRQGAEVATPRAQVALTAVLLFGGLTMMGTQLTAQAPLWPVLLAGIIATSLAVARMGR